MNKCKRGFSLLELLIALLIIGILLFISVPIYFNVLESAKRNAQHSNINSIQKLLDNYSLKNGRYPNISELSNIINNPANFFNELICPYNNKAYTITENLSYFRGSLANNNYLNAHILFYSTNGKTYTLWFYPPKFYVGNKQTKVFHYPWCWTLPSPQNQILFSTREDAIENGYRPCGNCKP
ncbi:MAG: Ada metal-binding domain-containing protein [Dictyoglomaceae bacterium]